jgi:hypothetical protein
MKKGRMVVGMVAGNGLHGAEIEGALAGQSENRIVRAIFGLLEEEWLSYANEETDPELDLPGIREIQGRREQCAVLKQRIAEMALRLPKK